MPNGFRAVTMADVAKEAGVSMTTVSHVINGTRHVNADTVKRVHQAIERSGYRPNTIARALAGARTQTIGLAVSGITNPYLMDFIAAIESEAANHGHSILLADTHDEPEKELQMVQELVLRRIDGLLIAPSAEAEAHALSFLQKQAVPTVLLDRFLPVDLDQVGTENEEPTAELVEHLTGREHRRIGLIAGLEGLSTTEERIKGYEIGLERGRIPVDRSLIAYGASQHEPARRAVHRLLDSENPPTALVAGNNLMTIGVLHALRDRQMRVPEDIALVAFDDFEWSDLFRPRLTVVAQPTGAIGRRAVQLLLARLEQPDSPAQTVRLPATLVHRESCGCPT